MQQNNVHNLMTQLTQEQKSLWRIEKHYVEESGNDEEKSFWGKMKVDKAEHIEELTALIKKSL
jgi:hypothetical protein